MEDLFQNGIVVETSTLNNTSYIVNKNEDFLITEYKVLKTKTSAGLIKCSKLLYNGKIKLVYFTNEFRALNTLWNAMDEDSCIRVLTNLFGTVIDLSNNGFLNCHNLVISDNRIFVDINNLTVHLVYLPVSNPNMDMTSFESDLRTRVLKALSSNNKLLTPRMNAFRGLLSNGILSIEETYRQMRIICKGGKGNAIKPIEGNCQKQQEHILRQVDESIIKGALNHKALEPAKLISLDVASPIAFSINKPEYIIGKNPNAADGVIGFNDAISLVHCKISIKQDEYWLTDLGSASGTYVNKGKLAPNQPIVIRNGDVIRLAKSDFRFKTGGRQDGKI